MELPKQQQQQAFPSISVEGGGLKYVKMAKMWLRSFISQACYFNKYLCVLA